MLPSTDDYYIEVFIKPQNVIRLLVYWRNQLNLVLYSSTLAPLIVTKGGPHHLLLILLILKGPYHAQSVIDLSYIILVQLVMERKVYISVKPFLCQLFLRPETAFVEVEHLGHKFEVFERLHTISN